MHGGTPPYPNHAPLPAYAAQTTFHRAQLVYLWLAALSVASLLIADITGVKLFSFSIMGVDVNHSCGMLTFPVTFLL
ncbi:MAG TPA: hypothetical protein VFF65_08535, partial [Phycisphaerales bacterium]|nr:hypothetical protein [Phycisphaerales bacterium]